MRRLSGVVLAVAAGLVLAGCPTGDTQPATNVAETSATLNARGNANGKPTDYWFEWGNTESYGSRTPTRAGGSGNAEQSVSETLTGLRPSTVYHFRAVARQGTKEYAGRDRAFATACPGGPPGTLRYPDLRTRTPYDLHFDTVSIDGRSQRVLRFSNEVWNAGEGKLELYGSDYPGATTTKVFQRIFDASGSCQPRYAGDYVFHPQHNHFHFGAFADYQLWTRAEWDAFVAGGRTDGAADSNGTKTTFCIMDTYRVQALAGSPSRAAYTTCGGDVQGMSVGWADRYGSELADQWVTVPGGGLADGRYVLRSVADPNNTLHESPNGADAAREGRQANEAIVGFSVSGGAIRIE